MKITDLTEEKWAKTISKKKETIFKKIFEGGNLWIKYIIYMK